MGVSIAMGDPQNGSKWLVYNGKIMENPIQMDYDWGTLRKPPFFSDKTIIHIIGGKVMPTRSPSGHQVVTKWSPSHSNCQRSGYLPSGKLTKLWKITIFNG